jgi:hypothetical protein
MSLQSIIKPNTYNLFCDKFNTVSDITVGGTVLGNAGIVFSTAPLSLTSASTNLTLPVVTLNSGIVFCSGDNGFTITLPSATDIMNTLSSIQVGQILSFHVILDNETSPAGHITVTVAPGAGITSKYSNPITITNDPDTTALDESFYREHIFHLQLVTPGPLYGFDLY